MNIWIDAQLSPLIALWITKELKVTAVPVRDINLREATDKEIFLKAKEESAVILTKDIDFSHLLDRFGAPPKIIWLTCGNTSNKKLKEILSTTLIPALKLLEGPDNIVEIRGN